MAEMLSDSTSCLYLRIRISVSSAGVAFHPSVPPSEGFKPAFRFLRSASGDSWNLRLLHLKMVTLTHNPLLKANLEWLKVQTSEVGVRSNDDTASGLLVLMFRQQNLQGESWRRRIRPTMFSSVNTGELQIPQISNTVVFPVVPLTCPRDFVPRKSISIKPGKKKRKSATVYSPKQA